MDGEARAELFNRGLDRIFEPALLDSITRLVDDVAERGDAALVDALAEYDGVQVDPE